ncbi:MAG: 2TM domain-containing protein [Bacteroidota bacterium]
MSKESYRQRVKGFKVHAMVYLGVIGFNWFTWLMSGSGYPWPLWPMMGWGMGLFFHYVGAVLSPRWGGNIEETSYAYSPEPEEEFISSEYRMEDQVDPAPRRRRRSNTEDWNGVDVQVHDIDEK